MLCEKCPSPKTKLGESEEVYNCPVDWKSLRGRRRRTPNFDEGLYNFGTPVRERPSAPHTWLEVRGSGCGISGLPHAPLSRVDVAEHVRFVFHRCHCYSNATRKQVGGADT
eukprot:SAG25_NODE_675_length_5983_cov_3.456152_2_plen_111_part_00